MRNLKPEVTHDALFSGNPSQTAALAAGVHPSRTYRRKAQAGGLHASLHLSVVAILWLATSLSHATESVAAGTGDSVGGLLDSTLGNLTDLVIIITALQAGKM
jgi:Ca2+/H+ antiporter